MCYSFGQTAFGWMCFVCLRVDLARQEFSECIQCVRKLLVHVGTVFKFVFILDDLMSKKNHWKMPTVLKGFSDDEWTGPSSVVSSLA